MNLDCYRKRFDQLLSERLPKDTSLLAEAMRYAVLQGGKRFRPLLVYATGLSLNANLIDLDYPAMAVEIIHAYSLVHDDLPAMDNDLLRRGQPTCHIKFGEAMAILAGDAMQAFAFEILSECVHSNTVKMLTILAKACGAQGTAGGQAQDLSVIGKVINEVDLQTIHRAKTGELIKASLMLGALASPSLTTQQLNQLENLGLSLGLAYQIQDDIFDVEVATEVRGKQQGADAALNKPTYPALLGMTNAKQKLESTAQHIQSQLSQMKLENSLLENLINEVLTRKL